VPPIASAVKEDLGGKGDEGDLAARARDELAGHQQPEVTGLSQWRDVECDPPDEVAGARRRGASLGLRHSS